MLGLTDSISNRLYPDAASRDPATSFLRNLERMVQPDWTVLDVGAGAGDCNPYRLRGRVARMIGVDFDPRIVGNELLDQGVCLDSPYLPFSDCSFDAVFSVYVWEHLEDPSLFLSEVFRVLKPGGKIFGITPNRFHYVPIIATLTPHWFHQFYNSVRGRSYEDTFPTFYRLNDLKTISRLMSQVGFERVSIEMVECRPNYLAISLPTFLLGVLYERVVNAIDFLKILRVNIICSAQKGTNV